MAGSRRHDGARGALDRQRAQREGKRTQREERNCRAADLQLSATGIGLGQGRPPDGRTRTRVDGVGKGEWD